VGLVSAVLGFLLRKVGVLLAVVASLFLGYLLVQAAVPALREAAADRDRLEQVSAEREALEAEAEDLRRVSEVGQKLAVASLASRVQAEVGDGRRAVVEQREELAAARSREDDICGTFTKVTDFILSQEKCALAQEAVARADAALDTIEENVSRAENAAAVLADPDLSNEQKLDRLQQQGERSAVDRELESTEAELTQKQAEEESLRAAQDSWAGFVVDQWLGSWRWLLGIALLVLLLPPLLRTVSYFVLMPVVSRLQRPVRLVPPADAERGRVTGTDARRTLEVVLGEGEVMSARSEHVRPVQGTVRSRLLYDWSAPFISYAAGLYFLTRVSGDARGVSATLATPDDPDSYLMRLDFEDHPGLVVRPRHVVGVIGSPGLTTRWRWGIHALATWQVRYIMFTGTGSLVVQGCGDVVATSPRGRAMKMEQSLVMGFDSRLSMGVRRTEVFWPYLRGTTPLLDDEFTGEQRLLWQKSTTDGTQNPVTRAFNTFFSAFGKLLGF